MSLEQLLTQVYEHQDYSQVLSPACFEQYADSDAFLSAFLFASLHTGQVAEAQSQLSQLLESGDTRPQVCYLLGECLEIQGRPHKALEYYYLSYQNTPQELGLLQNLSAAFIRHSCFQEALLIYQKYLQAIQPQLKDYLVLGTLLESTFQYTKAASLYQRLLQEHHFHLHLYQRLAYVYKMQGKAKGAANILLEALELCQQHLPQPEFHTPETWHWAQIHSEYIQALYLSGATESTLRQAQAHWQATHGAHHAQLSHQRQPKSRLRVGYISPDFRQSSLAILAYGLLSNHSTKHDYYIYHTSQAQDDITLLFQHLPHQWRDLGGQTPRQMASTIRGDQIDILVDLSGHTSSSCLSLLTHQLSPIQISGLGFNDFTGLEAIQYRLTDPICTPPQKKEHPMTETPLFLDSWICTLPPEEPLTPDIPDNKNMVFYSPHHPGKLNQEVLKTWGHILKARSESRLFLRHKAYADPDVQAYFRKGLIQNGARHTQIEFFKASPYQEYLAFYSNVDLVLDPFPCHGGMTSCDALMMGVPVLTLKSWMTGGCSLLTQVDKTEFIAQTPEDYIHIALKYQRQTRQQRQRLSQTFLKAPACQPKAMARQLEKHYTEIWSIP